jgi:uncharacterized protein with NRDE domain
VCLVVFALGRWANAPFVLAANRDEYFARPSAPAAWWKDEGRDVFGGRDLEKGGTWMGINRNGRIAVVTNVRDLAKPQTGKSRGYLPLLALASEPHLLNIDVAGYPAFNLLYGGGPITICVSDEKEERVGLGLHGLSNHRLDTPWPKVKRGIDALERFGPSKDALFEMLRDQTPASDADLPNTGVPLEVERKLSSPFVSMAEVGYGTRCSTVLVRRANGAIEFEERTWNERGELAGVVSVLL